MAPLAFAGGALATVTLSACYGSPCVSTVKLPDGGTRERQGSIVCQDFDCTAPGPDGGAQVQDAEWKYVCE